MSTTQQDPSKAEAAKDEASHVAGVASGEAQNVAREASSQARGLLDDARTQVTDQSRTQLGNLKDLLARLGDDLEQMAQGADQGGLAGDAARAVSERAKGLSSHLDGREPADLLEDVRDFARRRPGTFLLGALAAGVVAGRFARGAKEGASPAGGSTSGASVSTGDAAPVVQTVTAPASLPADPVVGGRVMPPASSADGPLADPGAPTLDDALTSDPLSRRDTLPGDAGDGGLR